MKLLPLVVSLFAVAAAPLAQADVIVYVGTGSAVAANSQTTATVPAKVTIITDATTLESRVVFANKAKFSTPVGNVTRKYVNTTSVVNVGRVDAKKGDKVNTYFVSGTTSYVSTTNFEYIAVKFSGKKASTVIEAEGEGLNFPKSLTGSVAATNSTAVGTSTITVNFNSAKSFDFNSRNLTLNAATAEVVDAYEAAGYDDEPF